MENRKFIARSARVITKHQIVSCLSIALFLQLSAVFALSPESPILGKYSYDAVNYILLMEGGIFTEQHITDLHALDASQPELGGAALEQEAVSLADGTYVVDAARIILTYVYDQYEVKYGIVEGDYISGQGIVINEKPYVKRGVSQTLPASSQSVGVMSADALPNNPLTTYDYDTDTQYEIIDSGIKAWQWHTAEAMRALNDNRYSIGYGSPLSLKPQYWTWTNRIGWGGWTPNASVRPSESIAWYFSDEPRREGYHTECITAARAVFCKGLLDTVGEEAFDEWFGDPNTDNRSHLVISHKGYAPSPLHYNKRIYSENQLVKGDWVYFQNCASSSSCPNIGVYQGLNAITQNSSNPRTYVGLGVPRPGAYPWTSQQIIYDLSVKCAIAGCQRVQDVQLWTSYVIIASANYFDNFIDRMNPIEISRSTGNNQTISHLSGSKGDHRHYRFVVPPDITRVSITTSGGWGDCDIYAKQDCWASPSLFDHASDSDSNAEAISITENVAGVWYIALHACEDYVDMNITVTDQSNISFN
jgi:hypothetical protein